MSLKNAVQNEGQEQMTILVETLTGTTFEVKVSPQDKVKSIKSKIQKVEGIPVSHQHLLYNSQELQDSSCVTEPSVALHDRATVKLVLSMRGGPISLIPQAVPLNRALLKRLVKFNRENLTDDLPPGCKMAILVLRVGDQLNFLHVVEDSDDSDDSLSSVPDSTSTDLLEGEISKTVEENSVTMEKVCDLKEKMGKLSLQRKSLKANGQDKDLSTDGPGTSTLNPTKPNNSVKLPSIGYQFTREMLKSRSEFSQVPILPGIVSQPMKNVSRELVSLGEGSTAQICDSVRPKTCPATISDDLYNPYYHRSIPRTPPQITTQFRSCYSACSNLRKEWIERSRMFRIKHNLPPIESASDALENHRDSLDMDRKNLPSSSTAVVENLNIHRNSNNTYKFDQSSRQESLSDSQKSNYSCRPSKITDISESTDLDWATLCSSLSACEPLPRVSRRLDSVISSTSTYGESSPTSTYGESSTTSTCGELPISKTKSKAVEPIVSSKKVNVDKKTRLRCSECKKRLPLTSTFECRCGLLFCTYHRYSEAHRCTHDFKKESRKMLEQANPSIVAPKLPKI